MKIDWKFVMEVAIGFLIASILLDVLNTLFLDEAIAKLKK